MMKRYAVGVVVAGVAVLMSSGVAHAAAVTCQDDEVCFGTNGSDSIKGSNGENDIRGLGGDDAISSGGSRDKVSGGTGADAIFGGAGNDLLVGSAIKLEDSDDENPLILRFTDRSNDVLAGGDGNDTIIAGYAQGGIDRVEGGSGNEIVFASARANRDFYEEIEVTKEIIGCGPGDDYVQFDAGIDVVDRDSCERLDPVTASKDTGSRYAVGDDNRLYFQDLE